MDHDPPTAPAPAPLTLVELLTRYMDQAPPWTPPPESAPTAPGGLPLLPVLRLEQLAELPPPAWLVADILPAGGLGCVYGAASAGKTFLAIDWSLGVLTGRPWAEHASRSGGVLYIAAEGQSGIYARVAAWEAQHGAARGRAFFVIPCAINLMEESSASQVLASLAAVGGIATDLALIVVDTLARCMPGGDENSARDMGRAIAGTDLLRRATGATVLLLHHSGKSGTVERGSSALRGACDMMASVSADDGVVTVECDKMKEAAPFPLSRWSLEARDGSCVLLPSSAVVLARPDRPLTSAQRKILEALAGAVLGGSAGAADIRAATNLGESTVFKALNALIARGFLDAGVGSPRVYRLTDAGAQMG